MDIKSIVRRLTPVECERLMGFPDNYLDIGNGKGGTTPDAPRYKGCGNSWISNNARWVNLRIEKVLRETGIVSDDRTIQYATTCSGVECHTISVNGQNWNANFYSEIEPFPCRVLEHHYPNVPNLGDMTKVDGTKYSLDMFSGGTPCQDFSVAGKRAGGMEGSGTRSSLAYHWMRIGKEALRPGGIMLWENVAGAFSSNGGADFAWFLWRLNEEGWSVAWRCMDGQYIWVDNHPRAIPQRRRRIWLCAYKGSDWRIPCRVLHERANRLGSLAPNRVVNGEVINSHDSADGQFDLFGGNTPLFDANSRADMIPFASMPGNGDFLNTSETELYSFFKTLGAVTYFGGIFSGTASVDNISSLLKENIGNAGVAMGGKVCCIKMSEWTSGIQLPDGVQCPKQFDGTVCGLSSVLEPMSDDMVKYFLSSRACNGILVRAGKRGKTLPEKLEKALHEQIANWACGKFGDDNNQDDESNATEDDSGEEENLVCED